jgi:hypothetical protein
MIVNGNETGRRSHAAALGAAGWLGLAAAPTFAVMALLSCVAGGDADMMCSAAHGASPLNGMVPMYVLMSVFHAAPWLKLVSGRRGAARRWLRTVAWEQEALTRRRSVAATPREETGESRKGWP